MPIARNDDWIKLRQIQHLLDTTRLCGSVVLKTILGRRIAMQEQTAEIAAVRAEIMTLLHQQLEVLDSPEGLSRTKLMECYDRQARVRALREQLQTIGKTEEINRSMSRGSSNVIVMASTREDSARGARAAAVGALDDRALRIS
jgi:hypothetical protein